MHRIVAATCAACCLLAWPTRALSGQAWNDPRTRALVERATERRARQLADTGLTDYRATAHGYLTFLAQVGEGFPDPPKIVKADELALEVYWRAPDMSKQRIVGRRDTLLLPTDIAYHRDHLGIVQNNFPNIIRLGDGDEVRDVPHPLSRSGLGVYDYAISDSLRITLPDRAINVYEVKIRPRDDHAAAAVGAMYIDRAEAQVVRMAFSFTRAALKDKQLEDVSIVIENALIENRFWLPRRQEIEIRRTGQWLDYPARGIIRGRWDICCYTVNGNLPNALFVGPEIAQAPLAEQRAYQWRGAILDSLPPDVRAVTDDDVRRVQNEARALVRSGALAQVKQTSLAARSISDFVRVNRVEGLAVGLGAARRFGSGFTARAIGRYGVADHEAKGEVSLGWQRANGFGLGLRASRWYADVGDEPETSTLRNSIAAQEFGSDYTDPFDARRIELFGDLGTHGGARWRLGAAYTSERPVVVRATPFTGRYEGTIGAWHVEGPLLALTVDRAAALAFLGTEVTTHLDLRGSRLHVSNATSALSGISRVSFGRAAARVSVERPFGAQRLVLRTTAAGAIGPDLPPQDLVSLGGPTSGPGYEYHELTGRLGLTQHVEWRTPVRFVAIPLGRFGSTGRGATLAPFAHAVYLARPAADAARGAGWYPSAGLGLFWLFDLVRFDVARGLRDGRFSFSVDLVRDFWTVL